MSSTKSDRLFLPVLALASILLMAGGLFAVREEAAVYQRFGTVVQRALMLDADGVLGLSTDSHKANLADCVLFFKSYQSLEARFQPEDTRLKAVTSCLKISDRIAELSPSYSLAWYTGASASLLLGDIAGFNRRLALSQATAPNEQWMVDLRVSLAEDNLGLLDSTSEKAHEQDLRLLVQSGLGLRDLATRYIRNTAFRERITTIVESMPPRDQQRFLDNLHWELSNAGY